jgi:DNA-binding MarR family transcriptional regulator
MNARRKTRLRVLRGYDVPADDYCRAAMIALIRVFGRWSDAAANLVRLHGLTLPHFEVLICLNSGEGISQQDLSERLMLTKGNICVIVQKMEAAGLIERLPDPVDQRLHRLYMTDAGRCLVAKAMPAHRALAEEIMSGLNPAEQKMLHGLLCRIDQAFDDRMPP